MYNVKDEQFEGPLDLLLSFIEKEKLDITQISLARITGSYLTAINEIKGDSADLAEFLVIAAKLLYIKSKTLIPNVQNEEEEAEIDDLEERLREYQKVKAAAKHLEMVLSEEVRSYKRQGKPESQIVFTPPNGIDQNGLFAIFQDVLERTPKEGPEKVEIEDVPKITLEEKRNHILSHLKKSKGKTSFKSILQKSKSKIEVIIVFLAILEMIKQKEVKVEQENNFSDFFVKSVE